jgi:hypothetical protein
VDNLIENMIEMAVSGPVDGFDWDACTDGMERDGQITQQAARRLKLAQPAAARQAALDALEPDFCMELRTPAARESFAPEYAALRLRLQSAHLRKRWLPCNALPFYLMPGTKVLIAGNTGAAKTTLSAQICMESVVQGKKVLYINTEMDTDKLDLIQFNNAAVALCRNGVDVGNWRETGLLTVRSWPGMGCPDYDKIVPTIRDLHETQLLTTGAGFDLVIFDQLNNIRAKSDDSAASEQYHVSAAVRDWLTIGASMHLPAVVLLQQLKDDPSKNGDTPTKLLIEGRKATLNDQDIVLSCRKKGDTRTFKLDKTRDPLLFAGNKDIVWKGGAYMDVLRTAPEQPQQTVQGTVSDVLGGT